MLITTYFFCKTFKYAAYWFKTSTARKVDEEDKKPMRKRYKTNLEQDTKTNREENVLF